MVTFLLWIPNYHIYLLSRQRQDFGTYIYVHTVPLSENVRTNVLCEYMPYVFSDPYIY